MSLSEEPEAEDGALGPEIERIKMDRSGSSVPRGGALATDPRVKLDRPGSPVPSCVSMKSDWSMNEPIMFNEGTFTPDPSFAGPGDAPCDFCTEKKLKAVKYCLTCTVSYCEIHIRWHYTVPALRRHRVVDISGDQESKLCQQHHKALELLCSTDQTLICSLCSAQEHRGHDIIFKSEQGLTKDMGRAVSDLTDELENFYTGGFQETDQTGWLETLKDKHKEALERKFEVVSEGIAKPGEQTLLNDVFTHVWITEGSC
uniref:B box-type domain-containing protein n=1 Tax=Lepisosteus oculatus TaxID=7918 RepID=W5LWT2_LEPOC